MPTTWTKRCLADRSGSKKLLPFALYRAHIACQQRLCKLEAAHCLFRSLACTSRSPRSLTMPFPLQELEARIVTVIEDYKEKLQLRTDHHMG